MNGFPSPMRTRTSEPLWVENTASASSFRITVTKVLPALRLYLAVSLAREAERSGVDQAKACEAAATLFAVPASDHGLLVGLVDLAERECFKARVVLLRERMVE